MPSLPSCHPLSHGACGSSTYETLWEKPYELVAAENLASKKARMSVIKERNKRQQRFLTQANKHTVAKASRLATKKAAMLTYQFEGFYAEKSTLHHAAVLLAETVHRRLSQLDIAARYYAKGSYDKAAASLVLSQRAGTRSLPALLALAHSHYLMWVSTFTYPSAFACDRAKEFTSPPPSTKLFRKRKQVLLSALEAYKQALPVSQISRVEDASINTSSPNTGELDLGAKSSNFVRRRCSHLFAHVYGSPIHGSDLMLDPPAICENPQPPWRLSRRW